MEPGTTSAARSTYSATGVRYPSRWRELEGEIKCGIMCSGDYPAAVRCVVPGGEDRFSFSKETTNRAPKANAILLRVATVDGCCPDSRREIADFVVPTRSAKACWDRPWSTRRRITCRAICSYGHIRSSSARYSGSRRARRAMAFSTGVPTGLFQPMRLMLSKSLTTLAGVMRSGSIVAGGPRRASWALIHPPLEIHPARRRNFYFGRRHRSCSFLKNVKQYK
jgi:hypothetical protein